MNTYHVPSVVFTTLVLFFHQAAWYALFQAILHPVVQSIIVNLFYKQENRLLPKVRELVSGEMVWLQKPALNHQGIWPVLSNSRTGSTGLFANKLSSNWRRDIPIMSASASTGSHGRSGRLGSITFPLPCVRTELQTCMAQTEKHVKHEFNTLVQMST